MSEQSDIQIQLNDVRCSFPDIFQKSVYEGKETSYGSKFILDPENETHSGYIAQISKAIAKLTKEVLEKNKIPDDKKCLRDGDNYDREELEGKMLVSSNSPVKPHVFMKGSNTEVAQDMEESQIFSGCYVNALIRIWADKKRNRVNAQLVGIQFKREGEPFSGEGKPPIEEAAKGFEVSDGEDFFDEAA